MKKVYTEAGVAIEHTPIEELVAQYEAYAPHQLSSWTDTGLNLLAHGRIPEHLRTDAERLLKALLAAEPVKVGDATECLVAGYDPTVPTPAMRDAGAQRLVRWEDDSKWPESWSELQVAGAKNDAERVWRSMWLASPVQRLLTTLLSEARQPISNPAERMLGRWMSFGRAMQKAGSHLPRNLIRETEQLLRVLGPDSENKD